MKAEQLRKSILQLAIQGKLVKQDPNDEPAPVLLERIRAEKQRLIKEGKIKKDKGDSIIFKGDDNCHYEKVGSEVKNIEDEIPFEIPDTWCWVRFPQLVYFELGKTPDRHTDKFWNKGIYPWFSIADMQDKKTITETKDKISEIALQEKFNGSLSPKGTLLMSFKLTVGRTSILGVDAVHNEAIISIFPYVCDSNIIRKYLMNTLGLLVNYVEQTDAIKGATLNSSKLKSLLIPVPPLAEQERIVKEIERFESLLAEYDKLEQQATKLDNEIYDKLKKSVLQYAIQGNLVEQDENDESASILLERIRAEKKAQLGKKYVESYIYKGDDNCYYEHIGGKDVNITEEIPYDLPSGWAWTRMGTIADVKGGKRIPAGRQLINDNNGHVYIRVIDMKDGSVSLDSLKYVPLDVVPIIKNYIISKDDLYLTIAGTIGKVGIIPDELDGMNLTENAVKLCNIKVDKHFLMKTIETAYVQSLFNEKTNKVAQPKLAIERILSCLIPVPPLAEQKRIVDKINEIFAKL